MSYSPLDFPCGHPLCGARVGEPCRHSGSQYKKAPHSNRVKWAKNMNKAAARRKP